MTREEFFNVLNSSGPYTESDVETVKAFITSAPMLRALRAVLGGFEQRRQANSLRLVHDQAEAVDHAYAVGVANGAIECITNIVALTEDQNAQAA